MSAPVLPVESRIAAIQARLDALAPAAAAGPALPAPLGGDPTFAAQLTLAAASPLPGAWSTGGAWEIPWAPGTEPAPPGAAVATFRTASLGAGAAGVDPLAVVVPLDGRRSQDFGPTSSVYSKPATVDGVRYAHFHDGIDIAAPLGRPVRAMAAGRVEFAGRYPDGAQVVRVRHADGSVALYAHLGRGLDVREGDRVGAGDVLGVVGMTGTTTGPHLHLELTVDGGAIDPGPVLASGRLPGAVTDLSVLPPGAGAASSGVDVLARFDRVAGGIPFAAEIRDAASAAGIDPLLLASLVKAESSFHPTSVSWAGALGLTQLMPATARAMKVEDPFDPAQNLRAGARYLATNLRLYGRVDLALAAYQAGKGAVARAGGIPDSPTTHHYIDRILHSWAGYLEAAA